MRRSNVSRETRGDKELLECVTLGAVVTAPQQLSFPGRKFKPRKTPPALEVATHIALADLLRRAALPGWWFTHIASEAHRSESGRALMARMGLKTGLPDFWLISPPGVCHFLELKRGRLGVVTDGQIEFAELCIERGIPYALARSFDEAVAVFRAWGVLRSVTL